MRLPHLLKIKYGHRKAFLTALTFPLSQIHRITCLHNLGKQILEWICCHTLRKLVLWKPDDNLMLTVGQGELPFPVTRFHRVYTKYKTITPCFHENGHWLGIENSIYFESSFISDLMGRHRKASRRAPVPGPPSILTLGNNQWCGQQSTKLWTQVQEVYSHILHFSHGRHGLISP